MHKGLLIGVGNRYRGDDAAGWRVAEKLSTGPHPGIEIVHSDGNVFTLLQWFRTHIWVCIVDAVPSGKGARIFKWNATDAPLPPTWRGTSSHALGVAEAIKIARVLNCLPAHLTVYGVPAREFGWQEGLSATTARAVDRTVRRIRHDWGLDSAAIRAPRHAAAQIRTPAARRRRG